jgi:hypothetical protein
MENGGPGSVSMGTPTGTPTSGEMLVEKPDEMPVEMPDEKPGEKPDEKPGPEEKPGEKQYEPNEPSGAADSGKETKVHTPFFDTFDYLMGLFLQDA